MTDLLLNPDTGEIPRVDPGQTTMNLAPYAALPPALRRPDATGEIALLPPSQPPMPDPLPPPPPPKPSAVWEAAPVDRAYVGVHRRPSRWDWLTVPLSMAVQRIWQSM